MLFDLAREVNRARSGSPAEAARLAALLKSLGAVLGLLQADPDHFLQQGTTPAPGGLTAEAIEALIQARLEARRNKRWAEADRIRDELKAQGILLEDGPTGTTWRRG